MLYNSLWIFISITNIFISFAVLTKYLLFFPMQWNPWKPRYKSPFDDVLEFSRTECLLRKGHKSEGGAKSLNEGETPIVAQLEKVAT